MNFDEADVVEPSRAIRLERVQQAREEYRERQREIAESVLSIEERLEAGRHALKQMRRSVTAAYRELRPQPFGEWLQEREERREQARPAAERHQERRQERNPGQFAFGEEQSQGHGRTHAR